MLKDRLLTAAVAAPLFLLALWFLPPLWFALLSAVLVAMGAWEWSQFVYSQRFAMRCIYTALVMASLGITFVVPIIVWLVIAGVIWLWALAGIVAYQKKHRSLGFASPIVKGLVGILLLMAFWLSLNVLRDTLLGPKLLLIGFIMIWVLDVGAYFAGRFLGKHHLASEVSPNKTWEGFIAGVLAAVIAAGVYTWLESMSVMNAWKFVLLGLIVALFAVLGDLFESLLKRHADIKDSGSLLPGHGGILDRFDSAIAALPIFALGLLFL